MKLSPKQVQQISSLLSPAITARLEGIAREQGLSLTRYIGMLFEKQKLNYVETSSVALISSMIAMALSRAKSSDATDDLAALRTLQSIVVDTILLNRDTIDKQLDSIK